MLIRFPSCHHPQTSRQSPSPSSSPLDWAEWMPECLYPAIALAFEMSSSSLSRLRNEDEDDDNDEEPITADDEDLGSSTTEPDDEDDEETEEEDEDEWEGDRVASEDEEPGAIEERRAAHQEEDMDIYSDEDAMDFSHLRKHRYSRTHHVNQPNQCRSLACLSCKETYNSRHAGICIECYDEASETKEALKKEIEELHARIAFLKTWAPEAMEEEYADILLECVDGSKIRAHRAVLISRSTVFKAMLAVEMEESRTNIIKITDFSYEVLRLFIHYLYTAEIYPESLEECAGDLLALAEKYNVKQLKVVCERFMISKLNCGNAISNFEYASLHGAKNLKQAALSTILESIQDLIGKPEYQNLVNRDARLVVEIYEAYLAKQMAKLSTK